MFPRTRPLPVALCCIVLGSIVLAETVAARTWIVDGAGGAGSDFRTIQAAVNAASDGDAILIRGGSYQEQVLIDGKGLRLVALAGVTQWGTVQVTPAPLLHIVNLPAQSEMHLRGLSQLRISRILGAGLRLENNAGRIWVEDCFLDNYDGSALHISNCAFVMLNEVRAQTNASTLSPLGIPVPAPGTIIEHGSRVSFLSGSSRGSHGPPSGTQPTAPLVGGAGLRISDSIVDLVALECRGGGGNSMLIGTCLHAAPGGAALEVDAPLGLPTRVRVRGGSLRAGGHGFFHANCAPQPSITPDLIDPHGFVQMLVGTPRLLLMPSHPLVDGSFTIAYSGEAGDLALGLIAVQTEWPVEIPGVDGELVLPLSQSILGFTGELDARGRGESIARFRSPGEAVHLHAQMVMLDRAGALWLSNPSTILLQ